MSLLLDEAQRPHVTRRAWFDALWSLPVGFIAALQFLTIIPPLVRRPFINSELGRAVGWFTLVGVILGVFLAWVNYGLEPIFPPTVTAALILAVWVLFTGALHLDGFLDCCDGLFGGHTPDARLRIMRDERVGAFAVIGGVLLLLVKFACLLSLADRTNALVLAPTLGRWGMAVSVVIFPYARSEGLGRTMKDYSGWRQILLATFVAVTASWLIATWLGLAAFVATVVCTLLIAGFTLRRIPGFTGDVYGAQCELLEVLTLLVLVGGETHEGS